MKIWKSWFFLPLDMVTSGCPILISCCLVDLFTLQLLFIILDFFICAFTVCDYILSLFCSLLYRSLLICRFKDWCSKFGFWICLCGNWKYQSHCISVSGFPRYIAFRLTLKILLGLWYYCLAYKNTHIHACCFCFSWYFNFVYLWTKIIYAGLVLGILSLILHLD